MMTPASIPFSPLLRLVSMLQSTHPVKPFDNPLPTLLKISDDIPSPPERCPRIWYRVSCMRSRREPSPRVCAMSAEKM